MQRHKVLSNIVPTGECLVCGRKLDKRNKKYCSVEHRELYYTHNYYLQFVAVIKKNRNYTCEKCGKRGKNKADVHIHHIVPISKGGSVMDSNNVKILCKDCHKDEHKKK